jgi:hypothetical protein
MSEFLTLVHECTDFNHWKSVYDDDAGNRKAAGLTDLLLARQADKPNVIALVFAVSDLAKARAMASSPAMHEKMKMAGIIGTPDMHYRTGEFAPRKAANYLSLNCRIRDLETFRKGYAMDKNERKSATLSDVGLAVDLGDANDLLLLWSFDDKAKVQAFLASPKLAEHQVKNAGVEGAERPACERRELGILHMRRSLE